MDRFIRPGALQGALTPPCSKSYAQRALAIALLTRGCTTLRNIELCDDTRSAIRSIRELGATVNEVDSSTLTIEGGLSPRSDLLQMGESGLATRLFTPIAALCSRPITITGEGTLLRRPMAMMAEPLRALGVEVLDGGGFLPIRVQGPMSGHEVTVDGAISSQFITGLLISLAARDEEATIRVENPVSLPYYDITIDTARYFGREILHNESYTEFYIPQGQLYRPTDLFIESDWSAAAAWLVAGALAGEVRVEHLSTLSKQADVAVCHALERAGAELICEQEALTCCRSDLRGFTFDATHSPDLFPVLTALAASASGESLIKGTSRLEYKESHRAEVLMQEYAKLGIEIDLSTPDWMRVRGGHIVGGTCSAHGDHRIAMALALSALRSERGIEILGAESVSKSYPSFFEDLEMLRVKPTE